MTNSRPTITMTYVRVCKDSGFNLSSTEAAKFTAELLRIHPMEVWTAVGSLSVLERIAAGDHPAIKEYAS